MGRFVEVDRHRKLVEVSFFGEVTYRERIETMQYIFPPMLKHRLRRLLLDFSGARPGAPDGTREELMEKILSAPALVGARVAFVNSLDVHGLPGGPVPAFETRRFDNRDDAEAWLLAVDP
ncbi:hypothetical protein LYSHEL_26120 [Lysobacter helvus]|uniref:STAS/SEC14 domain-containing protein n=2 Tax=Lysobacteraceae TaxID=32033 RepID=A0ABN6G0V5_9GAMM|nr:MULTISPECIES: hypothetical protein [Lysobacter]BCT93587.1 hypothetical protein LYSCAS_26110 [Lysobacter caseinilyticus]BCT96741.1 hypothetical protein LYSHEL_26120 [Lysobacter helvus]